MKLDTLVRKVQSHESLRSPPPDAPLTHLLRRKRKPVHKFSHVPCKVDTSPPLLRLTPPLALRSASKAIRLQQENMMLLRLIRNNHYTRGRVDSRWRELPAGNRQYHAARVDFSERTHKENQRLYKIFTTAEPRLTTTAKLEQWWTRMKRERERRSHGPWLLTPPAARMDPAFDAPEGVVRPRVSLSLRIRGGAALGELRLELFAEACVRTAAVFIALLPAYIGSVFHSDLEMLVPEAGATGELLLKVIGPEGQALVAYYPEDTLVEELKNRAVENFYRGGAGAARYKLVRVCDTATLHDFLTLAQEQLQPQEELLLVELRVPMAGALDLGAVRAPTPAAVAAATAALPPPRAAPRQPNLQALLATNELSHELRKILISLVEAGARLAAAGPHYERALQQLRAALQAPRPVTRPVVEVITPEEIAQRIAEREEHRPAPEVPAGDDAYRRAEHLQRFLEEFRAWRLSCAPAPDATALMTLAELGWEGAEAEGALRATGGAPPAAAAWLMGERGASVSELVDGLPDGAVLKALLQQQQIQRGLLNTRMLVAFIGMVGPANSAALWLSSPRGSPLLSQISRTYHSEKYCLAVNQFSEENNTRPSTSRPR